MVSELVAEAATGMGPGFMAGIPAVEPNPSREISASAYVCTSCSHALPRD